MSEMGWDGMGWDGMGWDEMCEKEKPLSHSDTDISPVCAS